MQKVDMINNNYRQFLVKYKSETTKKDFNFDFIFLIEFFLDFLHHVYNHSISCRESKVTLILHNKIVNVNVVLSHQIEVLDRCSSTLEFFS